MEYRLKEARKMKGITLREAGKLLGMSHNSVNKFERGELKIDSERLQQFATAYGVTLDYLIPKKIKVQFGEIIWFKIDWRISHPLA